VSKVPCHHPFTNQGRLAPVVMSVLCALPIWAQQRPGPWSTTVYLQQSWPKQTETNRQIQDINSTFGSGFQTWADVPNLNIGLQQLWEVAPFWKVGLELDYSRGKVRGVQVVDTLAGSAQLAFEQEYTLYADLIALAQFRPLGTQGRWTPFLQAGIGLAYEKDRTLLTLRNNLLDESLRVDNSGWFPVFTIGSGIDVFLAESRTWYAEVGVSYSWARLRHSVSAYGTLAPAATVMADTDSTGPNLWLGIGRHF